MTKSVEFLFELRTEEIPAGYIEPALRSARESLLNLFSENLLSIDESKLEVYATSRRMIFLHPEFPLNQLQSEEEVKGPPVEIALKDGAPTKALEGFMKKVGATQLSDLTKREEKGRDVFFFRKKIGGGSAAEIIPNIIVTMLTGLHFPKKMRWGSYDFAYPRPITGLLLLLDGQSLPLEIAGVSAASESVGHFIRSAQPFTVKSASDLFQGLEKGYVNFDQAKRRAKIQKALEQKAQELGLTLKTDEELLDIVNYLVEDPHVIDCSFPNDYLEIPDAVIVSEMREHQKYFALLDNKGNVTSKFLVVANMPQTPEIRNGNQRVLKARLEDGRFYYHEDIQQPLSGHVESLKRIVYQKEQGTIFEKAQRTAALAKTINTDLFDGKINGDDLEKTVLLAKADLCTKLVYEFPGLQGHIGRLYATREGLSEEIAWAIEEHYKPVFAGDTLPRSELGLAAALSDKLDNLLGNFSVGKIPTGSADPLGLRRQAMAVIEIILAVGKPFNMQSWLEKSIGLYPSPTAKTKKGDVPLHEFTWQFIAGRLHSVLGEKGLRKDFIDAALSFEPSDRQTGNIAGIWGVSEALAAQTGAGDGLGSILAALKRMGNIIKKESFEEKIDPGLFEDDSEKELFSGGQKLAELFHEAGNKQDYGPLFAHLESQAKSVDAFFDNVMVMADDPKIRNNRLSLLAGFVRPMSEIMDLTKIETG